MGLATIKVLKSLPILAGVMLLSGCLLGKHTTTNSVAYDSSVPPEPLRFSAYAHPLGMSKVPDSRAHHAYLLLGDSVDTAPELAKKACETLFIDQDLEKPAAALSPDHVVTYLLVKKSGDFRRVSSRFKWGMCQQLATIVDSEREQEVLERISYEGAQGPLLVVFESASASKNLTMKTANVTGNEAKALVVNLSQVSVDDMQTVISNWKYDIASVKGTTSTLSDLESSAGLLNKGLDHSNVALALTPNALNQTLLLSGVFH